MAKVLFSLRSLPQLSKASPLMAHSRYCLGGGIEYLSGCSSAWEAMLADSIAMYYGVRFAVHGDIHSFGCSKGHDTSFRGPSNRLFICDYLLEPAVV